MIRSIIWDVDGTLLDTYPAITGAFLEVVREHGGNGSTERIGELARVGLGHCARVLAGELGLPEEAVSEEFGARYREMPLEGQGPFEGAVDVCRSIRDSGGLNAVVTHRGTDSTRRLLERHGMEELFHLVVSVEDGYPKKPDPAAFHAVIEKCSLDVTETLAVGDREIDVRAGFSAGLRTALYGRARSDPEPDLRFTAYGELLPALADRGLWVAP